MATQEHRQGGWLERISRKALFRQLEEVTGGSITVIDRGQTHRFGSGGDLEVTCTIRQSEFFREGLLGGSVGIAESYIRGHWDCDDLTGLLRIVIRNSNRAVLIDGLTSKLASLMHRGYHWLRDNSRRGSRRNIAAHYDLGNEFFRLWLDETMAYSSGIFPFPGASLREASEEKFDRICRKLQLGRGDHVIEIGTGWGGFAIHAARNYGCRLTTTTISREQFELAGQRIDGAGLTGQIELLNRDYRELSGKYDKLVSIEMIEAVGYRHFDTFFGKCGELLNADGSMVVQGITMPEKRYPAYLRSVDFIQRYVFPGGCLPSIAAMLESAGRATDLRCVHLEDFAPHYAETLRIWRRSFRAHLNEVRRQGFSEEFLRLWDYYLCYCEAVFEERHVGVVQIQFDKPECRRDPLEISRDAAAVRGGQESISMDGCDSETAICPR